MAKLRKKDDDFTPRELIRYEQTFREPIGDIQNDEKPRLEKIAFLGWIKCLREDPDLKFDDYLDAAESLEQIQKDAFGDTSDEKK